MLTSYQLPSFQNNLQQLVANEIAIQTANGNTISISPGTDIYAELYSIAQLTSSIEYQGLNAVNASLVDSANGSDLDRLCALRNIFRKGATQSIGTVNFLTSSPQTILAGAVLNGPNSSVYQVQQTGLYSNGSFIPVSSVSVGSGANLGAGSILIWAVAPFNSQPTVTSNVISGAVDAESDSALRARLIFNYQYPPQNGNTSQIVVNAGSVDWVIQQAFVYPNFNGLGSLYIALTGNQTLSYIFRDIPSLPQDNVGNPGIILDPITNFPYNKYSWVDGYSGTYVSKNNVGTNLQFDIGNILGNLPINLGNPVCTTISTVNNIPTAVSILLDLPYPPGSNINSQPVIGTNGWVNYATWPNPSTNLPYNAVTSITSPTSFVVQSLSVVNGGNAPINNITQIAWINRGNSNGQGWIYQTDTITGATDLGLNQWEITIQNGFAFNDGYDDYGLQGLTLGDFIMPACINGQSYLNNIMAQYNLLGPGECTNVAGLINLGALRSPSTATYYPSVIDPRFLQIISQNNNEVIEAEFYQNTGVYLAQLNSTPAWTYSISAQGTPPVPNCPVNIYVPAQIQIADLNATQSYINSGK